MPEPVVLKVTRYRCAFCTRSYSKRATTISHMKTCSRDPAQRTCLTCKHDGQWGDYGDPPSCAIGIAKVWRENDSQAALPEVFRTKVEDERRSKPPLYNIDCPSWAPRKS